MISRGTVLATMVALVAAPGTGRGADTSLEPAWQLLRDGRAAEAAEAFRAAAAAGAPVEEAVRGRVTALIRDGRGTDAIAAAQGLLDARPDSPEAWAHLGRAYLASGRFAEAEQAFLESVSLGSSPLGEWGLGRIAETRGDLVEAAARFGEARRLAPEDDEILESFLRNIDDPEQERKGWTLWRSIERTGKPTTRAFVEAVLPVFPEYAAHRDVRFAPREGTGLPVVLPLERLPQPQGTKLDERRLVLTATVERGRSRKLLLDTGAHGLTLSPSAARAAGFREIASIRVAGAGNRSRGARSKLGVVRDLRLGPLVFRDGLAVRTSDSGFPDGVDGILGIDLFAPAVVEIDPGRLEFRVLPRDVTPEGFRHVEARRVDAHRLVEVVVAGRVRGWFLLDTGSSHSVVDLDAAAGLGGRTRSADWWIKGLTGVLKDLRTVPEATLEVAGRSRRDLGLLAYSLEGISTNLGVRITGVLGMSYLDGLVLKVDTAGAGVALRETNPVEDGQPVR